MKNLREKKEVFRLILSAIGAFVFGIVFQYLVVFGFRVESIERVFATEFVFQALAFGLLMLIALWSYHRVFDLPPKPDFKSFLKYVILPWTVLSFASYFYRFGLSGVIPNIDFFSRRLVNLVVFAALYFWNYAETGETPQTQTSK